MPKVVAIKPPTVNPQAIVRIEVNYPNHVGVHELVEAQLNAITQGTPNDAALHTFTNAGENRPMWFGAHNLGGGVWSFLLDDTDPGPNWWMEQ